MPIDYWPPIFNLARQCVISWLGTHFCLNSSQSLEYLIRMSGDKAKIAHRTAVSPNQDLVRGHLDAIAAQLSGMSYGSLVITVHDGRVVQLERTEKTRFF